ncbi:MAG: FlgT C-terminal domain-containing protein [Candidatus Omnitrophota bacterium]
MPQKTKLIIFGLFAVLLVSLLFSAQLYNAKLTLERERDSVKKENDALGRKVEESLQDNKRLQEKLTVFNQDIERLAGEKDELQKKYDSLKEERETLVQKLKEQAQAMEKLQAAKPAEQTAAAAPKTEDAFWANLLKTKADLEIQLANVRNELNSIRVTNEQLQREKAGLTLEVSTLTTENQDLKRQVDYNQKVLDSITKELVNEKNDKFEIQKNFKDIRSENSLLRQQLKGLIGNKANLETRLQELQTKYNDLQNNLSKMDTMLKDKMLQVDSLQKNLEQTMKGGSGEEKQDAVQLPPIVVRPQTESPGARATKAMSEGKVLLINRSNNFVIINLGEDAGVKAGDTFEVYRNNDTIARIEAVQTRKAISACDIVRENTPIKVGDSVR